MTVFAETNVDVDLRMLRSFRVLRPLKLVSKIPSELIYWQQSRVSPETLSDESLLITNLFQTVRTV